MNYFKISMIKKFFSKKFKISKNINRVGVRLIENPIKPTVSSNLASEGIIKGSIQVPGDGNPIVLAVYQVRVTGGKLDSADHETLDVRVFNVSELPELAFDHDRGILADWLKTREIVE